MVPGLGFGTANAELEAQMRGELGLAFRKLAKKDETTRLKAVQEIKVRLPPTFSSLSLFFSYILLIGAFGVSGGELGRGEGGGGALRGRVAFIVVGP